MPGFELRLLALEGPLHVDEVLAYAVHHALSLGDGLHLVAVGHVEDVEDRAVLVLGTRGHDACGDTGTLHDIAGQDEEGDGQQREFGHARKKVVGEHAEAQVPLPDDDQGRKAQGQRDGHTQDQRDGEQDQQPESRIVQ